MDKLSQWIVRFAPLVPEQASVLDLACGGGRHARFFLARGAHVTCVDRDLSGVADLAGRVELIAADLESGRPDAWPLASRRFDLVVVTNYLFRPLLARLPDCLTSGGLLLYETFGLGQERFGRPRNPDFLLRPGELLALAEGRLTVIAYEDGIEQRAAGPTVVQRICARSNDGAGPMPLYPVS
ncbi:MAG TPA: class I SAM-dependent methyltransferase [Rhodospirillaceae bacterium]|nr:class I SAM-dependent methyltransferase [Rhodospirillaceae bacterium]